MTDPHCPYPDFHLVAWSAPLTEAMTCCWDDCNADAVTMVRVPTGLESTTAGTMLHAEDFGLCAEHAAMRHLVAVGTDTELWGWGYRHG